ncbi:MAG: Fe-S cluster assembly sulfur transfer protein SufU [Antricoccus sp.]
MQLESMYQEILLDHYRNPLGKGLREPFDGESHQVNPTCGDEVTLRVKFSPDGTTIEDVSYDGYGCSISQASESVLYELTNGKSIDNALAKMAAFTAMVTSRGEDQGDEDVLGDGIAFAGVAKFPARVKCALLGWMALKEAAAKAGAITTEGN